MTTPYAFRRATADDLPLIGRWLAERHVAKWWRQDGESVADIAAYVARSHAEPHEPFIVEHAGEPIGYLQWYAAAVNDQLPPQPEGTRGIDFLIGEPSALGKGHGAAFLTQHVADCRAARVPRLVAAPDGRNVASVGCLGRAGFSPECLIGPPGQRLLLMHCDLIDQPPRSRPTDRPSRRRRDRP